MVDFIDALKKSSLTFIVGGLGGILWMLFMPKFGIPMLGWAFSIGMLVAGVYGFYLNSQSPAVKAALARAYRGGEGAISASPRSSVSGGGGSIGSHPSTISSSIPSHMEAGTRHIAGIPSLPAIGGRFVHSKAIDINPHKFNHLVDHKKRGRKFRAHYTSMDDQDVILPHPVVTGTATYGSRNAIDDSNHIYSNISDMY